MGVYRRKYKGKKSTWWISYVVGGRQKRESSGSKSKRVAEKILALRKTQALEGRLGLPKSHVPRLAEWFKRFLSSIGHPKTRSPLSVFHQQSTGILWRKNQAVGDYSRTSF